MSRSDWSIWCSEALIFSLCALRCSRSYLSSTKKESRAFANKIVAPVVKQIKQQNPDHFGSDCPVAGRHIEANLATGQTHVHPLQLLCKAYGIPESL